MTLQKILNDDEMELTEFRHDIIIEIKNLQETPIFYI